MVIADRKFEVIGTRPVRPDGIDKVTGRAQYGNDVTLQGTLFAKILRSPYAHARIVRIDTSKAEALPGVRAVVTHKDLPQAEDKVQDLGEGAVNLRYLSTNILADDKVLYRGHAIAAVAATSQHIAEEAVGLIEVEFDVLPPVVDVRDAMRPDAPLLHENLKTRSLGQMSDTPSNVASHMQLAKGDVEAGFAEADQIIEREYTTPMYHQGYIEPHACTALWNADGQLTVYTSTQGAFPVRAQLAELLRIPVSSVKVVPTEIGGGFGGKIPVYLDPVAALLSRKSGRPVKLAMSRTEVFEATGPTSGTYIKVKMGAKKDGTITAAEAMLAYEAGAYPGSPVGAGAMCMLAPYDLPNMKIDAYDVVLNKPKTSAYRAPGAPAAAFAAESVVDEFAEQLGIDPIEIRLKNAATEGTKQASGAVFPRIGNQEVLQAAAASPHYNAPLEGPNRGRGVANGFWFNAGMKSAVMAAVNPDGTVNLIEGSTDIGGTRASLAMQLAETLGLPYESVKPQVADTDSVGYNDVTGGSRVTFASGQAVYEAGMELIGKIKERAAKIWETDAANVQYDKGVLTHKTDSEKQMTFKEFAGKMLQTGPAIEAGGAVTAAGVGAAFCTQICDVEVDPDTGKVQVLRYSIIQDVGTAVHPSYVEGQMQGGAAQGIGMALSEEYFWDESGRMVNSSFLDYRMPTALDLPMLETELVEVFNPGHPFGVRGVGEVPIVAPLAAVANAVYRATGVRFHDLPISPARILEATVGIQE